ncbi:LamG domain-containing protein [Patescibacteria group bacterium]|nr:LamG domain-containing protein [Patescibacteria group bacterium]MBU1672989.1 LamG domain-containing protein [Patescibacteria group bacterium]MBU1962976.1 LamG domain-containing protein [Patescibacteria group bacterium]
MIKMNNKGISIAEVLIAIGIFSLVAAGIILLVTDAYDLSRFSAERNVAQAIVDEGMEATESIRQRAWNELTYGTHGLDDSLGYWVFSGIEDDLDPYTRITTVSEVYRDASGNIVDVGGTLDPQTKKVAVRVTWTFAPGRDQEIVLEKYFTLWQSSDWTQTTELDFSSGTDSGTLAGTAFDDGHVSLQGYVFDYIQSSVGSYNFNENTGTTANDRSGKGNNGNANNTSWVGGRYGSGLDFNGTDSNVQVPDSATQEPPVALSVELWMHLDTISDDWLVEKHTTTPTDYNHGFVLRTDNATQSLMWRVGNGSAYSDVKSPDNSISTGAWHHVAGIYNGSSAKLYLDGKLVAEAEFSGDIDYTSVGDLYIGASSINTLNTDGILDEVAVYNRVLTSSEIMDHFQNGILENNIRLHMDATSGTDVADSSGYGNNGNVTNPAWMTGRFGNSLEFSGTADFAVVPDNDSLDLADDITLAAWIKGDAAGGGGGGTPGQISDTVIDSEEFDNNQGNYPDAIHVSGDIYAITYSGPGNDGFLKTLTIDSNGNISSVIDTLEFDTSQATYPDIIHISGNIYAIAYGGAGNDGFVCTVEIDGSGNITNSVVDSWEYQTNNGETPSMLHVAGTVYAIAYDGPGSDGFVSTLNIANNGTITKSLIDTLEYDTSNGQSPDMILVSGQIYAIAYTGSGVDGWLATVDIASNGAIANSVVDSYEYDTSNGQNPDIISVSGNTYAIAYEGVGGDGWLATVEIATNGNITNSNLDTWEYDTSTGMQPSILHIIDDVFAIAYDAPLSQGTLVTLEIATNGTITKSFIDSLIFDSDTGQYPFLFGIDGDTYAVAYTGPGTDGWLASMDISSGGGTPEAIVKTDAYGLGIDYAAATSYGFINANKITASVTADDWHWVAMTYDNDLGSNQQKLFIDGVLAGQGTLADDINVNTNDFEVGKYFDGWVDEVQLYNKAMTTEQIYGLFMKNIDLVGQWHMNEGSWTGAADEVKDSSGFSHNGTAQNGASITTSGVFDNGGSFDGNNDFVSVADNYYLDMVNTGSVELWFKTSSDWTSHPDHEFLIGKDGNPGFGAYLDSGSGVLNFFLRESGGTAHTIISDSRLSDNEWHQMTAIWGDRGMKMYIDGTLQVNADAYTGNWNGNTIQLGIGALGTAGGANQHFEGDMDEVNIWSRMLSAGEVLDRYNNTALGWWRLADNSGTSTYDGAPYSNDGGLQPGGNEPTWVRGKFGSALQFDGIDDRVAISNDAVLNPTDSITLEAWTNFSGSGNLQNILTNGAWNRSLRAGGDTFWNPNKFVFQLTTGGSDHTLYSNTISAWGDWHHVAGTYDGATVKLFVDGRLSAQEDATGSIVAATADTFIGAESGLGYFYNGAIDEPRVNDRALSDSEIWDDYVYGLYGSYATTGTFISEQYDTGAPSSYNTFYWEESVSESHDLRMQVRTATNQAGLGAAAWYGDAGAGTFYANPVETQMSSDHNGDQWVQYQCLLDSDGTSTPKLNLLRINYTQQ